jgi:hypothetical protein
MTGELILRAVGMLLWELLWREGGGEIDFPWRIGRR